MSFFLQHVSKVITEDYQYPTWVPLVVFSLATIAIGGLMGLVSIAPDSNLVVTQCP